MSDRIESSYFPKEISTTSYAYWNSKSQFRDVRLEVWDSVRLKKSNQISELLPEFKSLPEWLFLPNDQKEEEMEEIARDHGMVVGKNIRFFLPGSFEYYTLRVLPPDYTFEEVDHLYPEYLPSNRSFIGFNKLKDTLKDPQAWDIVYSDVEPEENTYASFYFKDINEGLNSNDIETIMLALPEFLTDEQQRSKYVDLQKSFKELEQVGEELDSQLCFQYSRTLRQRLLNLRDVAVSLVGYRRYPEALIDYNQTVGNARMFLMREGRLVRAPLIERADILARVSKTLGKDVKYRPDVSKAVDVPDDEWLDADFIHARLLDPWLKNLSFPGLLG